MDNKGLPKTIEQFYSSEATSTENYKRLAHTFQIKIFLPRI